jgi:hypothetical protein
MSGRLVILPKKSWNVWNPANIEKVRKDEAAAAEKDALTAEADRNAAMLANIALMKGEAPPAKPDEPSKPGEPAQRGGQAAKEGGSKAAKEGKGGKGGGKGGKGKGDKAKVRRKPIGRALQLPRRTAATRCTTLVDMSISSPLRRDRLRQL